MASVGGFVDADVNDSAVQDVASWGVEQYAAQNGNEETLDSIQAAAKQVVAGMQWKLDVTTTPGGKKLQLTIWEKPWENFRELQSYTALN